MPATTPLYIRLCFAICRFLASITSIIHYFTSSVGIINVSPVIVNAHDGKFKSLKRIWFVRFVKRIVSALLRTPLRGNVTNLLTVDFDHRIGKGAVIVCCHTPWARLIANWCNENNYSMIVVGRSWEKRVNIASHVDNLSQIRNLVGHVRNRGRVIIMADVFNDSNDCPVSFMGKRYNASLLPLRLAQAANTKLIAVVPEIKNDSIHITFGPEFDLSKPAPHYTIVMQNIFSFLEAQITKDPSVWLRFIRSSAADKPVRDKDFKHFVPGQIEILNVERGVEPRPKPTV